MADTDVLVVGAGPTGLTLACELQRHGVRCRIVEQLAEQVIWSKAAAVHARTVEVFDDMGAADALLAYAKEIRGVRMYAGQELVTRIGFEDIPSPYPHVYGISQHDTELVLAQHLEKLGGRIERTQKLTGFEQDEQGVHAHLESGESITARYVVGCDGAHSAVRKALGFTFEGSSYEEHLLQADLHLDFPSRGDGDEIQAYLGKDGPIALFPLFKDGRYRVIVMLLAGTPDIEPTLDVFQRFLAERGPKGAVASDPAWMVAFRIHCRHTNHHRDRRAFVAGDAAHIHSPVGGQGMNTGIQDAYNLAWKLALVVKGRGRDVLLESYEAERKPVADALLTMTDTATRGIELFGGMKSSIAKGVRNRLIGFVTGMSAVQARFTKQLAMLDIHYDASPIIEASSLRDWVTFGDGPKPGARAPSSELLRGTKHALFLFDGATSTLTDNAKLAAIAERIDERYSDVVTTHVVGASTPNSEPDELRKAYGARAECLYLVRPDGYVAYRAQPADLHALESYLQSIFTSS